MTKYLATNESNPLQPACLIKTLKTFKRQNEAGNYFDINPRDPAVTASKRENINVEARLYPYTQLTLYTPIPA